MLPPKGNALKSVPLHERQPFRWRFLYMTALFVLGAAAWASGQPADLPKSASSPEKTIAAQMEQWWKELAGDDASRAYQTLWKLIDRPHQTVALFDDRLKLAPPPKVKDIDELIAALDSNLYTERVKATVELRKLGLLAKSALLRTAQNPASSEVHRRVKMLLERLAWMSLSPDELRMWRAIEVLEHLGTPEARQMLQRLAKQSPHLWQSAEAKNSLSRLQRNRKSPALAEKVAAVGTLEGHGSRVYGLAFSPVQNLLASAGADGRVVLWDANKGKSLAVLRHPASVWSVSYFPDGKTLATGCSDGLVRFWDVGSGKSLSALKAHRSIVYSVAISPNGKWLISGSGDHTIKVWELARKQLTGVLRGHKSTVWSTAFSPDGKSVISGSSDRKVKLWETITAGERVTFSGHSQFIRSVAFHADGRTVASSDSGGVVKLWDIRTGQAIRSFEAHPLAVRAITFSPDGKLLATAGVDRKVKLWDAASGKLIATLQGHKDKARSVAFSSDGRYLATGGYDSVIKLWKVSAS